MKAVHSPGRKPGKEKDPRRRERGVGGGYQALVAEQVAEGDLGGADRRKVSDSRLRGRREVEIASAVFFLDRR